MGSQFKAFDFPGEEGECQSGNRFSCLIFEFDQQASLKYRTVEWRNDAYYFYYFRICMLIMRHRKRANIITICSPGLEPTASACLCQYFCTSRQGMLFWSILSEEWAKKKVGQQLIQSVYPPHSPVTTTTTTTSLVQPAKISLLTSSTSYSEDWITYSRRWLSLWPAWGRWTQSKGLGLRTKEERWYRWEIGGNQCWDMGSRLSLRYKAWNWMGRGRRRIGKQTWGVWKPSAERAVGCRLWYGSSRTWGRTGRGNNS